jgi:hypothetical protein
MSRRDRRIWTEVSSLSAALVTSRKTMSRAAEPIVQAVLKLKMVIPAGWPSSPALFWRKIAARRKKTCRRTTGKFPPSGEFPSKFGA